MSQPSKSNLFALGLGLARRDDCRRAACLQGGFEFADGHAAFYWQRPKNSTPSSLEKLAAETADGVSLLIAMLMSQPAALPTTSQTIRLVIRAPLKSRWQIAIDRCQRKHAVPGRLPGLLLLARRDAELTASRSV